MEILWSEAVIADVASLDKAVARQVKNPVERFAESGAGNVKTLQGISAPEFRLRVGDWRVRFRIVGKLIDDCCVAFQ